MKTAPPFATIARLACATRAGDAVRGNGPSVVRDSLRRVRRAA